MAVIEEHFGNINEISAEFTIITFVNHRLGALDGGGEIHAIYTDFSKAFDKVNYKFVLDILKTADIQETSLEWPVSYLTDTFQIVKLNNHSSKHFPNSSGVSQVCHLGPLLSVLFINDISDCFRHSRFLHFAGDPKSCNTIYPIGRTGLNRFLNILLYVFSQHSNILYSPGKIVSNFTPIWTDLTGSVRFTQWNLTSGRVTLEL